MLTISANGKFGSYWGQNILEVASKLCFINSYIGGARGVMVFVVGNGHGDTSSNPGRDCLHFT